MENLISKMIREIKEQIRYVLLYDCKRKHCPWILSWKQNEKYIWYHITAKNKVKWMKCS